MDSSLDLPSDALIDFGLYLAGYIIVALMTCLLPGREAGRNPGFGNRESMAIRDRADRSVGPLTAALPGFRLGDGSAVIGYCRCR